MPTTICVGDHPYFLTFFITMIPIECKFTNFSLYLIVFFIVHTASKERMITRINFLVHSNVN